MSSGIDESIQTYQMRDFLIYAHESNRWPDVIGWHSSDFPRSYTSGTTAHYPKQIYARPCDQDILAEVQDIWAIADSLGHGDSTKVAIGEGWAIPHDVEIEDKDSVMRKAFLIAPGYLIRTYAAAERARKWLRDDNPDCSDCDLLFVNSLYSSNRGYGFLSGLVDSLDDGSWIRRRAWWLAEAYAQMGGDYVFIDSPDTSTANYDGFASKDTEEITVLVGNFNDSQPLTVRLDSLNHVPFISDEEIVQVKAYKVKIDSVSFINWKDPASADQKRDGLILPNLDPPRAVADAQLSDLLIPSMDKRYVVDQHGSLEIQILNEVGSPDTLLSGEAIVLKITPPNLATVGHPGTFQTLQAAIDAVDLGDRIEVGQKVGGYSPIELRPGVDLVAVADSVLIQGEVASPAVTFPIGTTPGTTITGFMIEGGDATSCVDVKGGGLVSNCSITGTVDSTWHGITISAGTGDKFTIKNSQIVGSYSGFYYPTAAILCSEADTVRIDSCVVRWYGDASATSVGVRFNFGVNWTEISNCLIVGPGKGVDNLSAGNDGVVVNCTVDSTYHGIRTTSHFSIQNTIVSNVAGGANTIGDFTTCILPTTGITSGTYDGTTVLEDPGYCPDSYTLKADSYGNPANNPSGQVIGAYPVTCIEGTLARTTHVQGLTLDVTDSVTISAGDSLVVGPSSIFNVSRSGIRFNNYGTLLCSGASGDSIRFTMADPDSCCWDGIKSTQADSCFLDYVTIDYASPGLTVAGMSADVRHSRITAPTDPGTIGVDIGSILDMPTKVVVSDCTIEGRVGVEVTDSDTSDSAGVELQSTDSSFRGELPLSKGILATMASIELNDCVVHGNEAGLLVAGGICSLTGDMDVTAGSGGTALLAQAAAAVSADVSIDLDAQASGFHSSGIGIWANNASAQMSAGRVGECDYGIWVDGTNGEITVGAESDSAEYVASVLIEDCKYVGIGIDSDANNLIRQTRVEGGDDDDYVGIQLLPDSQSTLERCTLVGGSGDNTIQVFVESDADLSAIQVTGDNNVSTDDVGIRVDTDSLEIVEIGKYVVIDYPDTTYFHTDITGCERGLDIVGLSRPRVRDSKIHDNRHCVAIDLFAVPDLGTTNDHGNNEISGSTKLGLAGGPLRGGPGVPDVSAEYNWWGTSPPADSLISSWVDYVPYLGSSPYQWTSRKYVEIVEVVPELVRKRPSPIPFAQSIAMELAITRGGSDVVVDVYDVQGRRCKVLESGRLARGAYEIVWDGENEAGMAMASGIYFIRVLVDSELQVFKILRVR